MDDPLIGRQLANFRIERLIGRGGMAQVYYGQDVKLQRPVAIKVISAHYRDSPAYAARFVREARAVATWRHENIIQIYYADDKDELYYFAMEYIDGPDLGELLSQHAAQGELMPHDEVLRIGRAIANALDYAHQQGVIHRDVKPANVMLASDGRVVLTDFGLAMDVQRGSVGEVFGSAHYIAPEQARRSADAVPQSDLYSLGIILYEILAGVVPFDDPSSTTVALQHVTQPPPPPREINPDLNQETEAVLLKALSKSLHERYRTGNELMDALERALQVGQPASVEGAELPPPPASLQPPAAPAVPLPATDDLVGRQLDEYRLDELLGKGGMARVYRGLDVRLKRWAAIKVIDTPFRTDSDYAVRFEREAQAVAQLEHPHIVRLYRYGQVDDLLYMAMQYIEGADLGSVLKSYREDREFIEPEDANRIMREVCLALDYAHDKGVIHRDIKPANIMLDKQGRAILTDFGLALLTEIGTRGEILGSPHYLAPEQAISSAHVTPQSDLYAVGVILYEMFTGELPFDAEEPLDVAMLHMTEEPRPPRELRPDISPALEAVILKALAKEPQDRYPSGAALADALEQALQATARPATGAEAAPSPATASRMTVLERVTLEVTDHPLPPVPAAITPPAPRSVVPRAAPAPAPRSVVPRAAPAPAAPTINRRLIYISIGIGVSSLVLVALLAIILLLKQDTSATDTQTKTPAPTSIAILTPTGATELAATPSQASPTAPSTSPLPTDTTESAVIPSQATPTPSSISPLPTDTTESAAPPSQATPTIVPATAASPPPLTDTPAPVEATVAPPIAESPTSVAAGPASYDLLIVKRGEDSLFVVNRSAEAFPLAWLSLSDGKGVINGADWSLEMLGNGACVAAWKDKGEPQPPEGLACNQVGERLTRGGKELFWKETFNVYYGGDPVGICDKEQDECSVNISTQPSYHLLIAKQDDEGLFVINWATEALPLAPLRLGDDGGAVNGSDWGIGTLEKDACVTVGKDEGNKDPDGLTCHQVGTHLTRRDKKEQFWRSEFDVYYNNEQVGTCRKDQEKCAIIIPYSSSP